MKSENPLNCLNSNQRCKGGSWQLTLIYYNVYLISTPTLNLSVRSKSKLLGPTKLQLISFIIIFILYFVSILFFGAKEEPAGPKKLINSSCSYASSVPLQDFLKPFRRLIQNRRPPTTSFFVPD